MTLVETLRAADEAGLTLRVRNCRLSVIPKAFTPEARLTPGLRAELVRHKAHLLELDRLYGLNYFAGGCVAPPAPRAPFDLIDRLVGLRDGRTGLLREIEWDSRKNLLRYCVEVNGERLLVGPEALAERRSA